MIIDQKLIDKVTDDAKNSDRLRMNYNFHDTPDAPSQRMLNALEPGTVMPIHRYCHTSESYILLQGRMNVIFYDDSGKEISRFMLDPHCRNYGVNIPKGMWHSLEVLESGTIIFE